jgi:hypothetical protein
MRWFRAVGTVIVVTFTPCLLVAAPHQAIGFAAGESQFTVGSSLVQGQATLFEGDRISSSYLATRLNLKNGSRFILGVDSEGTVRRDAFVLQSGSVDLINAGQTARVLAASFEVAAEKPSSYANVYLTGKNQVTVLVRSGEVKVARASGAQWTTIGAGQLVSLKAGPRGSIQASSDGAVSDVTRVQSEQLATLSGAARSYTCLVPAVAGISRSFAKLSSQLAVNEAAKTAIQSKIDAGTATAADLRTLASLNTNIENLSRASAAVSASLNDAVYQFHHPGPPQPFTSPHTIHGHVDEFPHHGQHGHSVINLPPGHHAPLPPGHQVTG